VDALLRSRRPLLIAAAAALFAVACWGQSNGTAVGVSDKPSGGRGAADAGAAAPVDGASALPSSYKTTFAKVNKARFVSTGHATGRWEVDIWANEIAQKALASRAREVPVGAIVVEEHFERSQSAAPEKARGPVMVMEKRPPGFSKEHGDWRWAVVGSQGQLVKDGTIESCAGCHDDAPMDGLFPIVD